MVSEGIINVSSNSGGAASLNFLGGLTGKVWFDIFLFFFGRLLGKEGGSPSLGKL